MSSIPKQNLTPQEYLKIERAAQTRSEFYRGEMFAMSGASRQHGRIAINLGSEIHGQLKTTTCEAFIGDMRTKISPTGLYTYPDIVVVCEDSQFEDAELDTLLNPILVVEILSKSTERYDREAKFEHYKTIKSLREYVLIAQNRAMVEQFTRGENNRWWQQAKFNFSDNLEFTSVNVSVKLADLYARVKVPDGLPGVVREPISESYQERPGIPV